GGVLLVLTLQNRHYHQSMIETTSVCTVRGEWRSVGGDQGSGIRDQGYTPRVQVSPINIIVAVARALSEPPQQSPIFGQRALSQTTVNTVHRKPASFTKGGLIPGTQRKGGYPSRDTAEGVYWERG